MFARQAVFGIIGATIIRETMSRHIQQMALRECHSKVRITLLAILSNIDCSQNPPMSSSRPIDSTQSCAILAPRLLQLACIYSSSNISIEYWHQYQSQQRQPMQRITILWATLRCDIVRLWLYYKATPARHGARHEPKESLFSVGLDATTGLPHHAQRPRLQRGNPSPHKNSHFLCQ